jgi:two-component system OmpR family sensor kinase
MKRTDEAKTARYLKHAREDLERLGAMVDDILLTRRISDSALVIEPEVLDLAERAAQKLDRLRELHSGVTLALDAPQAVYAHADPTGFDQILENLVSNAVKYGGEGSTVDVSVAADDDGALLTVRDHGPGLGDAKPNDLLEPFVRGGDERVRTRPGVGLGLYIVRELARAHGGDLDLKEASDGGGIRVQVRLPRAPAPVHGNQAGEAATGAAGSEEAGVSKEGAA